MKTGTQPHVDKFRTFFYSASCYLHGKAQEPSKLAPRVAKAIHPKGAVTVIYSNTCRFDYLGTLIY
eukprot:6181418-Pleurochrysis_carterae.AAC.7